jgi:phosphatidylglycerol:prolipoprotein diacylglycerol transferase
MIPYPKIDPVFLQIGPLAFRWYGLMYALAFLFANWFIPRMAKVRKLALTPEHLSDFIFYVAIGVILGGRLGYILFYNIGFYLEHPLSIFSIWEGGMSFHGGMLGVVIAGALFCRSRGISFYQMADASLVSLPVGLGLGRIGNFINGELVGRPTDVPWCMVFPGAGPECRHPSQLYQAGLEGVVLFFILWTLSRRSTAPGLICGSFFLFYGLFRMMTEFFRQPDDHIGFVIASFSMGQLLSLPMFVVGILIVARALRVGTKNPA